MLHRWRLILKFSPMNVRAYAHLLCLLKLVLDVLLIDPGTTYSRASDLYIPSFKMSVVNASIADKYT